MVARGLLPVTACRICAALARGNNDHSSAMAPVTNGAAKLVPLSLTVAPSPPKLSIASPAALSPRRPIESHRAKRPRLAPQRTDSNPPGATSATGHT